MTTEELFDDLKQFIEATVSQYAAELRNDLHGEIAVVRGEVRQVNTRMETLDEKLDLIQEAVGESLLQAAGETKASLQDHDRRLQRLEHNVA
jgi:archaellum component FlaC